MPLYYTRSFVHGIGKTLLAGAEDGETERWVVTSLEVPGLCEALGPTGVVR